MAVGPHRLTRLVALMAAGITIVSASSDAMSANSRVCRQLEAELTSSGGGRSTAQLAKQDSAIVKQREQLQMAKQRARGAGCGFSLFGGGVAKCGEINGKIERMERNLDALQRKRQALAGGGSGRSRAKIIAALDANGCRDQQMAERRLPDGVDSNRNLFDRIFGGGLRQLSSLDDDLGDDVPLRNEEANVRRAPGSRQGNWINEDGHIRFAPPPGEYRTLCVRTCDGYFFPMSNASSPGDFDRDQTNCETSCPGTDVQIYYHQTSGEESADMISLASGAPYSDLPTAYLYKQPGTPRPASCGCSRPNNYESFAMTPPQSEAVQSEPVIPTPADRPDPGADPETLANSDGGLDSEMLRRLAVAPKTKRTGEEDKKVRVVGPMFLPDPGAAINLQAPVPTQVR